MKLTPTPNAVEGLVGVTAIEANSAAVTVKVLEALVSSLLIPLRLAEIVTTPTAFAVNNPVELSLATKVSLLVQDTDEEISRLLPSENMPVAMNCLLRPMGSDWVVGLIWISVSVAPLFPPLSLLPPPPQAESDKAKMTVKIEWKKNSELTLFLRIIEIPLCPYGYFTC